MPNSVPDYVPTPYITHITKSGEPIESAQVNTDLSTIDEIPSSEANANAISSNLKLLTIGAVVSVILAVSATTAVLLGILLSTSTGSTTTMTTTTATTMTTTSATTTTVTTNTIRTTTSTSTSTTSTSVTTTTTTTSTTTTTGSTLTCSSNETIYAVWNTTAGGDSTAATNGSGVGNYWPTEPPLYACDNNYADSYTNFGTCNSGSNSATCGLNTGFYRTPQRGASLLVAIQVCTRSNLPARDPLIITLEGSNQPVSALNLGSSWTLIYSGLSGLSTDPGRGACGTVQFFSNSVWYTSYRFLVVSKRGADSSASYSEVTFIGY